MPVSVVCETTANVNAAIRESLGNGGGCSTSSTSVSDDAKAIANVSCSVANSDDGESLQNKLVASAKRVLLSKLEYEEVNNYGQAVLDNLKSKYIVLKPSGHNNCSNNENGSASPAACNQNNTENGANGDGGAAVKKFLSPKSTKTNDNELLCSCSSSTPSHSNSYTICTCSHIPDINGNTATSATSLVRRRANNPNKLPQPKRILYPRGNVRIGWKAAGHKWDVGVGMINLGNTCYLNSTLQALFHVPSMANWLMSDTTHMDRCDIADAGCIICAMAKTLHDSQTSQSAIRPYYVYSKLKSICKHLVVGRQEDAHEFLRYLVEAMEKSYLLRFRNYKELDQFSKETTPLNQILGGYLKSAVRCLACNHVSVTFQHFQDLLLDIRKADTVEEALECYFSREKLEDMGYKCESCKKKVSATKQFSLERAPIALCVQLKRFSMQGTKLIKEISIKPRLDLTNYLSRNASEQQLTYRLVSMVTHLGASQHCGHYTAIGLTESGTYYKYDDSCVQPIPVEDVCETNAYIIFYEMDTQPQRVATSTQISETQTTEKEYAQSVKVNGHVLGNNSQRMIGPQLPPSGLPNYSHTTNGSPLASLTNGGKISVNRASAISRCSSNSTNNCKIATQFKNNISNNVSPPCGKTSATTFLITSASVTSTSNSSNFAGLKNNDVTINNNVHHGMATEKYQETSPAKSLLANTTNKRQTAIATNDKESSSSDDEDEIVSSSNSSMEVVTPQAVLPSMPKLGAEVTTSTKSSNPSINKSSQPPIATKNNACNKKSQPAPLKSLVPYGSETDDEADASSALSPAISTPAEQLLLQQQQQQPKRLAPNSSKRHQCNSASSNNCSGNSNDNNNNDDDANANDLENKPTKGSKMKKAASTTTISNLALTPKSSVKSIDSSKTMKRATTDGAIDEIFNSTITAITNGQTPSKKSQYKSQNKSFTASTCDSSSDSEENNSRQKLSNTARPTLKRPHSMPPSPSVIKSKVGNWQVTTIPTSTVVTSSCTSSMTAVNGTVTEKPVKNPKNPFAGNKHPISHETKRSKKETRNKTFAGHGYQRDASSDSAVNEMLKQSHRGYGVLVLSWNGRPAEIEKEIIDEVREQRHRDRQYDDENDMDRGRQKKMKSQIKNCRTPDLIHSKNRKIKNVGDGFIRILINIIIVSSILISVLGIFVAIFNVINLNFNDSSINFQNVILQPLTYCIHDVTLN
uniref:Ubiquitin carboxyl-terminal hydrolase 36 n=1 Tax=Glossina morsitans morsitans TaxID=37546 RepID=A0A1B0G329_GLOMM